MAVAHNPAYGKVDAYDTAYHAIISSMRKVVSVGAKPAALTDCLCFGNPEKPEQMQDIIDAIRGIKEACESVPLYDYSDSPTPIISGNVSLYNVSGDVDIPASPIISCLGVLENVGDVLTPHIKQAGSCLLLLTNNNPVYKEFFALIKLSRTHHLLACQVVDLGGLALALMTMSFRNSIGFSIHERLDFFSEHGGFVLEIHPSQINAVIKIYG